MIYFLTGTNQTLSCGHIGEANIAPKDHWQKIVCVQADGDELHRCWEILGRDTIARVQVRHYNFVDSEARTITLNWY